MSARLIRSVMKSAAAAAAKKFWCSLTLYCVFGAKLGVENKIKKRKRACNHLINNQVQERGGDSLESTKKLLKKIKCFKLCSFTLLAFQATMSASIFLLFFCYSQRLDKDEE